MKRKFGFLSLISALLLSGSTIAQTSDQKIGIGAHLGISDYYGDLSKQFFDVGKTWRNQGGLTFSYYINPFMDVAASATYGGIGYDQAQGQSFGANLFQANAQLRFKFHNGMMLAEDSKIQPFIFGGVGIADWANVGINDNVVLNTVPQTDLLWTAGAGATYMFLPNWGLIIHFFMDTPMEIQKMV